MRLLELYGIRRRKADDGEDVEEEKLEPLPKISSDELWPPSPRVKILYIGLGFGIFNVLLLAIWVYVMVALR